jgi:nitrite reductase (NADH) large subunit
VCIGGGLLGLETAAALRARGASATVLEGFEWLLPRQLARPASELVQQHLEQLGIAVQCGARVAEIVGDEEVRGVRLANGRELPADVVVLATGVRPNSYLALQSGLEVKRGVVVDDGMRTSDSSILAAGDVAEHRGVVYGLWPIALEQGAVAGANAAGADRSFCGAQPANQLKVLDLPVFSVGQFAPGDAADTVVEHRDGSAYRHLVCHDGALVGANLIGDMRLAGAIKSAIETGQQLAELPELLQQLPELRELH